MKIYSKFPGNLPLAHGSGSVNVSNVNNLFLCKLVVAAEFSRPCPCIPSTLPDSIFNISTSSIRKQVAGIAARWIVAMVTHIKALIKTPTNKNVSHSVCCGDVPLVTEQPVFPISIPGSSPWPAFIYSTNGHLFPKSICNLFRFMEPLHPFFETLFSRFVTHISVWVEHYGFGSSRPAAGLFVFRKDAQNLSVPSGKAPPKCYASSSGGIVIANVENLDLETALSGSYLSILHSVLARLGYWPGEPSHCDKPC